METEFNWWIAIALLFIHVVINYLYHLHYFLGAKISEFRDLIRNLIHGVLTFGITYGVLAYTKNPWYIVSIVLGILAGYMAVKYFPKKLSNKG